MTAACELPTERDDPRDALLDAAEDMIRRAIALGLEPQMRARMAPFGELAERIVAELPRCEPVPQPSRVGIEWIGGQSFETGIAFAHGGVFVADVPAECEAAE